jgi:hypothetical protein
LDRYDSVYTRDGNGRYTRLMPGPKGDVTLPAGAEGLPPPEVSASKQWGRAADQALGTATEAAGCALTGCGWYIVIVIALNVLFGLIMFVLGWK